MTGIMYKDFLIMKKELLLNGLEILVAVVFLCLPWNSILEDASAVTETINGHTITFVVMPILMYFMIFLTLGGLQNNLFSADEKKSYAAFIISTPQTARGQIRCKYCETLLLALTGVLLGLICDGISSLVLGEKGSARTIYLSLFVIQIFFRAIDMPFLIRYGQSQGKFVKILMLLLAAFGGIVYVLFGPLPDLDSSTVIEKLILWFLDENKKSALWSKAKVIGPCAAFVMFYLSYRIAVRQYQKRVCD